MLTYDVVVLGAGPGGYEAALECARLGQKTALIEAENLGGTCLNKGCIPTKALLHLSSLYYDAQNQKGHGISISSMGFDFREMQSHTYEKVKKLRKGIAYLEKSHKVDVYFGKGTFIDKNRIGFGDEVVFGDKIIIATGSYPSRPPIEGIVNPKVMTSDDILQSKYEFPERVVIMGGGVIGVEFATLFSDLGCEVTIVEMLPTILSGLDAELITSVSNVLKRKGVTILTSTSVGKFEANEKLIVHCSSNEETRILECDYCFNCTGRKPATDMLNLEDIGVVMNKGYIETNEYLQTSVSNIYAIGDVTGYKQLAHVATEQGITAARNCAGQKSTVNYQRIPACVYTVPEIATVGLNEEECKAQNRNFQIGKYAVSSNGRALTMEQKEGFAKIISDRRTGEILGVHLAAPNASEMIGGLCAVMNSEGTIDELASTVFPHPSVSEIIMEAARAILRE